MSDIALQFNKQPIAAVSMVANIDSGWIDLSDVNGYCVHAIWVGAPVGNVVIQASLDKTNTKDLSTTAGGGADGAVFSNVDGVHYPFIKVIYSYTSGTGSLTVNISGKKNP